MKLNELVKTKFLPPNFRIIDKFNYGVTSDFGGIKAFARSINCGTKSYIAPDGNWGFSSYSYSSIKDAFAACWENFEKKKNDVYRYGDKL